MCPVDSAAQLLAKNSLHYLMKWQKASLVLFKFMVKEVCAFHLSLMVLHTPQNHLWEQAMLLKEQKKKVEWIQTCVQQYRLYMYVPDHVKITKLHYSVLFLQLKAYSKQYIHRICFIFTDLMATPVCGEKTPWPRKGIFTRIFEWGVSGTISEISATILPRMYSF